MSQIKYGVLIRDYKIEHQDFVNMIRAVCNAVNYYHKNVFEGFSLFESVVINLYKDNNGKFLDYDDNEIFLFEENVRIPAFEIIAQKMEADEVVFADLKDEKEAEIISKFNLNNIGDYEKIISYLIFDTKEITDEKIKIASEIIKRLNEIIILFNKLAEKKVIIKEYFKKPQMYASVAALIIKYTTSIIETIMVKFTKAHKGEIEIKGPIAIIKDYNILFPFRVSTYLYEKGVYCILAKESPDSDKYVLYPIRRPTVMDFEELNNADKQIPVVKKFVLMGLQEGFIYYDDKLRIKFPTIGNNTYRKFKPIRFFLIEENLESFAKLAKRITEGKIKITLSIDDGADNFTIKDHDELVVSESAFTPYKDELGINYK